MLPDLKGTCLNLRIFCFFFTLVKFRFISIPKSGKWSFELESDDGSRLLVDDVQARFTVGGSY